MFYTLPCSIILLNGNLGTIKYSFYPFRMRTKKLLNSVISQTYKNIEVIVVDDGSHDKTAQIVESIIQHDDRVKLLQQPNSGVSAARNRAIEKGSRLCLVSAY